MSVDGQRAHREKHHHAIESCPRKDRPVFGNDKGECEGDQDVLQIWAR